MINTTVLNYNILEKIGRGGMGVVYKAYDTRLQRTVALKFLPEDFAATETDKARFLREARAASAINHPNVCTIFDLKEHEEKQFIIMEFIEGETLKDLIKSQRQLPIDQVVEYVKQIAEALYAAHEKGVIHRDIKSENIMLTPAGQIKVMDFGLARIKGASELTKSASTGGTVAYMSPEHLDGREIDTRADIFSFGVVFYELLSGHLPFKGESPSTMINSILNKEPEPLTKYREDTPRAILQIVQRTLEKEKEKRYENIINLLDDLSDKQNGKNNIRQSDLAKMSQKRKWRSLKYNRGLAIGIASVVLLVVGIFILLPFVRKTDLPLQIIPITSGEGFAEGAEFSPDGKQVVYHCRKKRSKKS